MRLRPAHAGLGLITLAVVAGLVWWQGDDAEQPLITASTTSPDKPAPFARSLQDTRPDGDLQALQTVSGAGAPSALAYGELRRLFDYYLSTVGEQSIEAITAHIRTELQRRLPPPQALKAQRLLALYIEFKRELVDLEAKPELAGNAVAAIRRRMLAVQDLRARYFSADEVEGMFGFEDAYDLDAVARLEISQDPALSAQHKQQRLAALDAAMPETLRKERDASNVVVRIEQQAQALRAQGASEDDVYRMRARELDPQAAARLADVDREEAAWKGRIARYLDERVRVLKAQANASESERQASVAQLRQGLFSETERPRLVAYE
ncbi:MAG: lipase secretion chaperone [Burkholderiales bacterium]|nr:lipase secretion chaperone [Burkholderiales bacterium]